MKIIPFEPDTPKQETPRKASRSNGHDDTSGASFDDRGRGEPLSDRQITPNPIKLLSYAEMVALPEGEFLIQGVIVRRAKNVLFGLSNSFKSFMATDMGGSVSTGRTYHGMAVKKCPVIYVANEGANAVGRKRIPAWMAAYEIPQAERGNIYLVNVETILPNETSRNNLLAAIRAVVEPGEDFFLIIDVLRGTMAGSDSDDEAAPAWTMAAEIVVAEGATILTLTHSAYSDDGRIRGSSHLWGSFEGRLHAEGDKEKRTCILKIDRFKDHDSSNGQWGFQLNEVETGEHPGETSLVPRLDGEVKPKLSRKRKLPASAQNALSALAMSSKRRAQSLRPLIISRHTPNASPSSNGVNTPTCARGSTSRTARKKPLTGALRPSSPKNKRRPGEISHGLSKALQGQMPQFGPSGQPGQGGAQYFVPLGPIERSHRGEQPGQTGQKAGRQSCHPRHSKRDRQDTLLKGVSLLSRCPCLSALLRQRISFNVARHHPHHPQVSSFR